MLSRLIAVAFLLIAVAAGAEELPVWAVQPEHTAQLGDEVAMPKFSFRPPKGYRYVGDLETTVGRTYTFIGPLRRDRTAPILLIASLRMPATMRANTEEGLHRALRNAVTYALLTSPADAKKMSRDKTELGRVGEVVFGSTRWAGKKGGRSLTGFVYVTMGKDAVSFLYGDWDRHADKSWGVAEASAFTLRPR